MDMKEKFKTGDKVQRNQRYLKQRPGTPQEECIVSGFTPGGYLDTNMGWRVGETMEVVERDGIRLGESVHVGLAYPWTVTSFPKVGCIGVACGGAKAVIESSGVTRWKVTSDERRMENAEPKDKEGHPEPFAVSGEGKVFIHESKIGITAADIKQPAPAAQQYQDMVDALIRYNALVDRFPDAPKFKLVTL